MVFHMYFWYYGLSLYKPCHLQPFNLMTKTKFARKVTSWFLKSTGDARKVTSRFLKPTGDASKSLCAQIGTT